MHVLSGLPILVEILEAWKVSESLRAEWLPTNGRVTVTKLLPTLERKRTEINIIS